MCVKFRRLITCVALLVGATASAQSLAVAGRAMGPAQGTQAAESLV